jgi:geranylgeranyl transferase type-2 subunit alpha
LAVSMVEFELVKQALYIDPNDQSGWLYHRWLAGRGDDPAVLEREIGVITEILELEVDSKCASILSLSVIVSFLGSHPDMLI